MPRPPVLLVAMMQYNMMHCIEITVLALHCVALHWLGSERLLVHKDTYYNVYL